MKYLLLSLFAGVFSLYVHGVDNLRLPDVRSVGMGGNVATQSILFNPALIVDKDKKSIHLEYFNRYMLKELGTMSGSFYYPNQLFINRIIDKIINNRFIANSQIEYSVDKWMEYVEELALETEDTERIESLYADLSYLTEHPFDLNAVTEEQLKRLPFLSDRQIEQLLSYRKRYGNMVSIYELKNIEDIDFQTISLLLPFVYIGDNLLKNGCLRLRTC